MKTRYLPAVLAAASFVTPVGRLMAEEASGLDLMELAAAAYELGDEYNGDIYAELSQMQQLSEIEDEYDWAPYRKLKSKLKDRSKKPFHCEAVEFFEATSNSDEDHVCFVIDFSQSMKGKRIELLRHELNDTIEHLPVGTKVSVLFFAGPTWIPGDPVTPQANKFHYTVEHEGLDYQWSGKGAHDWSFDTQPAMPLWQEVDASLKQKMKGLVKQQPLVFGTDWEPPLTTALKLDPLPNVIYFMTDGACSSAAESSKIISAEAQQKGVRINAIAMMEPKAEKPMRFLAHSTGGDFVTISKDCKCHLEKAGEHDDHDDHQSDSKKPTKKKDKRVRDKRKANKASKRK